MQRNFSQYACSLFYVERRGGVSIIDGSIAYLLCLPPIRGPRRRRANILRTHEHTHERIERNHFDYVWQC